MSDMTEDEIAAFRAKATAHNRTIRAALKAQVDDVALRVRALQANAAKMVITDVNEDLRLRDVIVTASANYLANHEQIIEPILNTALPPA